MSGQTAEFKALTIMVSAAVVKIKYHALGKTACEPPNIAERARPGWIKTPFLQRRLILALLACIMCADGDLFAENSNVYSTKK